MRIAASPYAESALIADALRRAHLVDGVPWSQMAVIVRSVPRCGAALARTLAIAGVPVDPPAPTAPLADQPAVQALLTVMGATADGLDGATALALLTGPIGRVDPVSLRQLRRALRRADGDQPPREIGDLLMDAIAHEPAAGASASLRVGGLSAEQARPLRRVRAVLAAARRSAADGGDPRYTLWQAWQRSGLQRRWLAASERGGSAGEQADRDLDAVTALFDIAEQYVNRTAGASLRGLIDHVTALGLPATPRDDRDESDSVTIVSAHAALGREWDVVVIAGLQEGLWPNTIPRGGVLGTQQLVDVLDGVASADASGLSTRAPLLAEERRLLIAAMGRARSRLLVTAVDTDNGDESMLPSSFCYELATLASEPEPAVADTDTAPRGYWRRRHWSAGCARWSALRMAPSTKKYALVRQRNWRGWPQQASSGADPARWYAHDAAVHRGAAVERCRPHVTLSPSTLADAYRLPAALAARTPRRYRRRDIRSAVGSLLHALVADSGRPKARCSTSSKRSGTSYHSIPLGMRTTNLHAIARCCPPSPNGGRRPDEGSPRSAPRSTSTASSAHGDGGPDVRVRGRVDRLERDDAGRLVVVDIKTGKTPVTKDDAQHHAQLAMYQLAIAEGLLSQGDSPGGGRLVYLGKTRVGGATEREQDALTPDSRAEWRGLVQRAAAATQGPEFLARINDGCAHCPVRAMCPAQAAAGGSA